jgi:hypothetical protein
LYFLGGGGGYVTRFGGGLGVVYFGCGGYTGFFDTLYLGGGFVTGFFGGL